MSESLASAGVPNADNGIITCTPFEFEILKLGREQLTSGPHGGNFTPGYVRKETGKGYNAINSALSILTKYGLLERGSHTTLRDGRNVEISLYKVTERGIEALDKIGAGSIRIEDRAPTAKAMTPTHRERGSDRDDAAASIRRLEGNVSSILSALNELHAKVDRLSAGRSVATGGAPPKRARHSDASAHNLMVMESLKELSGNSRHALAKDVARRYAELCTAKGLKAGSDAYFKKVIVALEGQSLVKKKHVGCRSLGIHGHGSRLMLELTQEGFEFLAKNGADMG
jgi:hypothetical protein